MLHFRTATLTDIPALVKLRIEFLKEVMQTDTPAADITAGLVEYFSKHLQDSSYINWLALDGNTIVSTGGICFYRLPPNFFNPTGNRAYILNVYTLPAYRRRGISKQLFAKLMLEAGNRDIMQVSLHTSADGKPLYDQFGFYLKDNEMVWGRHV